MGQKVNPISFRTTIHKDWKAKWFSSRKQFAQFLEEDIKIRDLILKKWPRRGIARVVIERGPSNVNISAYTSKPGLIIGRGGTGIEEMKKELEKISISKEKIEINIEEVKNPELHAVLVADNVAQALEKKISFRRVLKQALDKIKQAGAQGAKIAVSGRLNGVEMARREWVSFGKIPLQTLRADIDFAQAEAKTAYGAIGVKVWVYKGETSRKTANEGMV